jgi:hypothetical protein
MAPRKFTVQGKQISSHYRYETNTVIRGADKRGEWQ